MLSHANKIVKNKESTNQELKKKIEAMERIIRNTSNQPDFTSANLPQTTFVLGGSNVIKKQEEVVEVVNTFYRPDDEVII